MFVFTSKHGNQESALSAIPRVATMVALQICLIQILIQKYESNLLHHRKDFLVFSLRSLPEAILQNLTG